MKLSKSLYWAPDRSIVFSLFVASHICTSDACGRVQIAGVRAYGVIVFVDVWMVVTIAIHYEALVTRKRLEVRELLPHGVILQCAQTSIICA